MFAPELAFILSMAKQIRDAVAHPSSVVEPGTVLSEKEYWLSNPDFGQLTQIVDNAIALERKIEATIRGNEKRLFWLHSRTAEGAFGALLPTIAGEPHRLLRLIARAFARSRCSCSSWDPGRVRQTRIR
jgi:hypothetical protein